MNFFLIINWPSFGRTLSPASVGSNAFSPHARNESLEQKWPKFNDKKLQLINISTSCGNKFSKHCSCQVSIWTQLFIFTWQILQRFICMKASHTVIFNSMSHFYDIKAACLESWSCWVVVEQNFWGKKYQLIAFVHNERGSNVFLWM